MKLEIWLNEFYPKILKDFGFRAEDDESSAKLMHDLGRGKLLDSSVLKNVIERKDIVIIGGAVSEKDLPHIGDRVKITAGKAILRISELIPDFVPDVHVTDMEEPDDILIELERRGCVLVLHAHGDNVHRIRSVVPKLRSFIATTQSKPFDRIYNFTGFTDGDRAVIIAKEFGARKIELLGFDFRKAEGIKLKKLMWAERILKFEDII